MNSIIPESQHAGRRPVHVSAHRAALRGRRPEPLNGFLAGMIGGIAGTLAMDSVLLAWTLLNLDHEGPVGVFERALRLHHTGIWGQSEPRAHHFAEDTPSERIAEALLRNLGVSREMVRRLRRPGGTLTHYGFGATMGGIYGLLAEFAPSITRGRGLPFGAAVLVAADEIGLPAAGLARSPFETRASTHAYAAAGHFAYGFVTELVRMAMRGNPRNGR